MTSLPISNCLGDSVARRKKQEECLLEQIKEKSRKLQEEREEMEDYVAHMKQIRRQEDCLMREREINLFRRKKAYGRDLKEQAAYKEKIEDPFDDSSINTGYLVESTQQRLLHRAKHPFRKAIERIDPNAYREPPPNARPWNYVPPGAPPNTDNTHAHNYKLCP